MTVRGHVHQYGDFEVKQAQLLMEPTEGRQALSKMLLNVITYRAGKGKLDQIYRQLGLDKVLGEGKVFRGDSEAYLLTTAYLSV